MEHHKRAMHARQRSARLRVQCAAKCGAHRRAIFPTAHACRASLQKCARRGRLANMVTACRGDTKCSPERSMNFKPPLANVYTLHPTRARAHPIRCAGKRARRSWYASTLAGALHRCRAIRVAAASAGALAPPHAAPCAAHHAPRAHTPNVRSRVTYPAYAHDHQTNVYLARSPYRVTRPCNHDIYTYVNVACKFAAREKRRSPVQARRVNL